MVDVKIGTFNVYNLVNPNFTYYETKKYSTNEYNDKVQWIGGQLRQMDCDLVGFQEVWHQEALADASGRSGLAYTSVIADGADGSGPVVGLATSLDVEHVEYIREIPEEARIRIPGFPTPIEAFHRSVLKAKVNFPDIGQVVVFVAHLKSKRPEYLDDENEDDFRIKAIGAARSLAIRTAEAVGLRALVLEENSETDTPIIVLGDLNDGNTSVTTNIISGPAPFVFSPPTAKKIYWDKLLYNVVNLQAKRSLGPMYYTYIYNGIYEVLDMILVSEEFVRANPNHKAKFEYVHVFRDHFSDLLLSGEGAVITKSDHAQVVARFQIVQ